MAYRRTFWVDHVTDQNGEVLQYGTLMDQEHFNNLEEGLSDAGLALAMTQFKQAQDGYQFEDEVHIVDLAMDNLPWPFNNKQTTVALKNLRENVNYGVEVNVISYSGGRLGNITVMGRALNGFKLVHDGSATNVKVGIRVSGGMTGPVY